MCIFSKPAAKHSELSSYFRLVFNNEEWSSLVLFLNWNVSDGSAYLNCAGLNLVSFFLMGLMRSCVPNFLNLLNFERISRFFSWIKLPLPTRLFFLPIICDFFVKRIFLCPSCVSALDFSMTFNSIVHVLWEELILCCSLHSIFVILTLYGSLC